MPNRLLRRGGRGGFDSRVGSYKPLTSLAVSFLWGEAFNGGNSLAYGWSVFLLAVELLLLTVCVGTS